MQAYKYWKILSGRNIEIKRKDNSSKFVDLTIFLRMIEILCYLICTKLKAYKHSHIVFKSISLATSKVYPMIH